MPLPPLLMRPAWRHGSQTPWGGKRLKEVFGKDAPDETAGESLEVSCVPGLESRCADGRPLPELIRRYGQALTGTSFHGDFPLLLKLLDAREALSVQVHPGVAYAKAHYGKRGKNEAWVVLDARPGARLICGFKDGVTREAVARAADGSDAIEPLLRHIAVRPGDALFIPEGTVHAIGDGLLLYEIQQSSDLTFRLYDWGRTGRDGRPRALHLRESLDVIRADSRPAVSRPVPVNAGAAGRCELLLGTPYFKLERLSACNGFQIEPDKTQFSILTALMDGTLAWDGGALALPKGATALLPAEGFSLRYSGESALLCRPGPAA